MILQLGRQYVGRDDTILQYDERLRDSASDRIGRCDDGRFEHRCVFDEHVLDFRPGDVVAAADDQIVGTALIPEVAVFVLPVDVARNVPAAAHVLALPFGLPPVPASGWAANRKEPGCAARHFAKILVHDARVVAGHDRAGGTGTNGSGTGGDEDVEHLGRPDAVQELDPRPAAPFFVDRGGQRLAGAHAEA